MANDHEQLLIDFIGPLIDPVPVSTRHASEPPYLRIRRVGGAASTRVSEDVVVAVESYARTETEALSRLEQVRVWFLGVASSVAVTGVIRRVQELGAPINLPDPETPGIERYSMTMGLTARRI